MLVRILKCLLIQLKSELKHKLKISICGPKFTKDKITTTVLQNYLNGYLLFFFGTIALNKTYIQLKGK